MLGILIFFIFAIGLLKDYSKWICITMILLVFLSPINFGGQNVSAFLCIFILLLYPFKLKQRTFKERFPLTLPFLLLTTAYYLSNHFSTDPHNGTMVSCIISNCVVIGIFYYIFLNDTNKLLPLFIKFCVIFGAIVGLYSIFEVITNHNPIMQSLMDNGWIQMEKIITDSRFGIKRSQGIFTMHGTNGAIATELFTVILGGLTTGYLKKNKFNYLTLSTLAITVFLSGTRSAILALVICSLSFINIKILKIKHLLFFLLFILIIYLCFHSYFNNIIMSFIDTESVEGSSEDMRSNQLAISTFFFLQSPIYGNGISYCANNIMGTYKEMYGAESLWFPVMIDTGILGILGYILFFICSIKYCIIRHSVNVIFFILGFLVLNTLSSIPGLIITWIFPFIMVLVEISRIKQNQ